jgi:uncharacterized LabA/DUF88 family protein
MPPEKNRVIVFIDGQNLYHLAKENWGDGYHWPKYDPIKLSKELVALEPDRILTEVRFHTGVPTWEQNPRWHAFWTAKLRALQSQGVWIYRGRILKEREKGVDVRIALDLVKLARRQVYETAIVVSQDSDLNEALKEVVEIAKGQKRHVHLESAFPYEAGKDTSHRGLTPSTWRHIDRAMYDRCADPRDYRKPSPGQVPVTVADLKSKFKPRN